ncbi:MAG: hypothetical protein OXP12_01790 [Thaumarchaeota archaeon]|nr:hypothetical protein [Nitrososphaerota archaeon]
MKALLMPHPVLRPEGTDYRAGLRFAMSLAGRPTHTLDGEILVPVRFDLKSRFMQGLIRDGRAGINVVVKCARTYERSVFKVDGTEATLRLPLGRYADKISLSPYVYAAEPIRPFRSAEHHAEFSGMRMDLPAGAILARGCDEELTIDSLQTLSAAIRLMTNSDLEEGRYDVDVEGDYIEISMHEKTRRDVESLRKTNLRVLYQSVYMAALTHAIQNVAQVRGRKWEVALRRTLEKIDVAVDNEEDLRDNAYRYAQILLQFPVKHIADLPGVSSAVGEGGRGYDE